MAKPWNLASKLDARSPRIVLVVCSTLAAMLCGCRAVDNAQVDVLERELRQQEDYIYELEDYLIEYSEKLRHCRSCSPEMMADSTTTQAPTRRGAKPEPTLANDPLQSATPRRRNGSRIMPPIEDPLTPVDAFDAPPLEAPALPAREAAPATTPSLLPTAPTTPLRAPSITPAVDPAEIEAPGLEIGPTSNLDWKGAAPIATTPPGDEAPPYIPDPADYQLDAEPNTAAEATIPPQVDEAMVEADEAPRLIAPEATAGNEAAEPTLPPPSDPQRLIAQQLQIRRVFRDAPDAEGSQPRSLMIVVEALNATDEPVDANGEVSLMVMAGETQETLKRVERWDFTAEETQAAWQSSGLGDGLHLELPLQADSLPEGRLELWARLVNADGVKLLTRVPFSASDLGPLDIDAGRPTPTAETAVAASTDDASAAAGEASATRTAAQAVASAPAAGQLESSSVTQWKASNEPLSAAPVVASASTVGGASTGGWTTQAPGRLPAMPTPRVASASGAPRWQQGSGEAPASESPRAWMPFR